MNKLRTLSKKDRAITLLSGSVIVLCLSGVWWLPQVISTGWINESGRGPLPPQKTPADFTKRPEPQAIASRMDWHPADFFATPTNLAIAKAITYNDEQLLDDLLAEKPDLDAQGKDGVTLLYWAYMEHDMEAFKKLLAIGANPDLKLSRTFLGKDYYFVEGDSVAFSGMRHLKYGYPFFHAALPFIRDANHRDAQQNTLLHAFLSNFYRPISDLPQVLEIGVDLDAKGADGQTACQLALGWGKAEECLMLLEAGADPEIKNDKGEDLGEIAARSLKICSRQVQNERVKAKTKKLRTVHHLVNVYKLRKQDEAELKAEEEAKAKSASLSRDYASD